MRPDAALQGDDRLMAYLPALRAWFAKRMQGGRMAADIDDLVQDVVVRMQARRQTSAIDNIEGYLFQVAASVLADFGRKDQVRRGSAHIALEEYHHPVEDRTPDRVLEGRQEIARLIAALAQLPERTRTVFVLHRFEEMSYAAIATQLGLSVSAVEKHMMKAFRFLTAEGIG